MELYCICYMKISKNLIECDDGSFYHSNFDTNLINKILNRNPKIILEFGSFDGGDALRYKAIYPKCEIHSIEACPKLFKNIQYLKKYNIKIYNYAITNETKKITFYQTFSIRKNKTGPSGSTLKPTRYVKNLHKHIKYNENPILVNGITIKDFCEKYEIKNIDFMHADTQGNIINVIEGFGEFKPKILFAEVNMHEQYKNADTFDQTNNKLNKLSYTLYSYKGYDAIFILDNEK